ncbi:MAG: hypothetical protein QM608_18920 [Caulobacter sp.]
MNGLELEAWDTLHGPIRLGAEKFYAPYGQNFLPTHREAETASKMLD